MRPHLLVRDPFPRVIHQLLHRRKIHLLVELLEDIVSLLEAEQDVFLDKREFDRLDLLAYNDDDQSLARLKKA